TGNPVYPFGFSLFGGCEWDSAGSRTLAAYFHSFDMLEPSLAARHALVVRHLWKLLAMTVIAIALPAPRWARGFALAAGGFAIMQVTVSDNARFLLPAVPFAAMTLAWWIDRVAARFPAAGWAVAAFLAYASLPTAWSQTVGSWPVVLGAESREAFVGRYAE